MSNQYFNSAVIATDDSVNVNVTKLYDDKGQINVNIIVSDAALTARVAALEAK